MKVLLLFPPFCLPTFVPVGMAQLKSYLEERNPNISVKCLDLNAMLHANLLHSKNKEPDEFLQQITRMHEELNNEIESLFNQGEVPSDFIIEQLKPVLSEEFDVLGISVMLTTQWNYSCLIAKVIKELRPNVKVVFGGSTFSVNPEQLFDAKFMDFAIYGEGEIGFETLLRSIMAGKGHNYIPNLVYCNKRKIAANKRSELPSLKSMPVPDYSDYKLGDYIMPKIVMPIYTSRSCPWKKCTYCVHYKTFAAYRQKQVGQVIDEIRLRVKSGLIHFNFIDEMLTPAYMNSLCNAIIDNKLKVFWHTTCSPRGFDSALLRKMHLAGCRIIYWGVESGSQHILDRMRKGTRIQEIGKILKASHKAGIANYAMIIIGFPGEGQTELNETCRFLETHRQYISSVHVSAFFLYKGSYIFSHPSEFGISRIHDKDRCLRNYRYELGKGMKYDEIVMEYNSRQQYFDSFAKVSLSFNIMRDIALLYHSKDG